MPCPACTGYFGDYQSGGDVFPAEDWAIVDSIEHPVGTHGGHVGMTGTASCKACGQRASFTCSYGPGYTFAARD